MKRSPFHKPKQVLVFNGAYVLVSICRSIRSASELTGCTAQAISFACTGRHISAGTLYFRHLDANVEVSNAVDLGVLTLQEYDELCNVVRLYHSVKEMARRRKIGTDKRKANPQKTTNYDEE